MTQTVARIAGWLALAFIAFATLSPIYDRPTIGDAQFEHFAAFALLGLALALGYPRRLPWVVAIVVVSAILLEAMQLLTPDRHGRVLDAVVKIVGGLSGISAGWLVLALLQNQIDRFRKLRGQSAD